MENNIEENSKNYKFVAVINKDITHPGIAMNALAHMTAGLVANVGSEVRDKMSFINLYDKDKNIHPSVSALSLIVLRGTSNEIAKLKHQAVELGIEYVDFLESMTGDTYKEQVIRTAQLNANDLNFYGIIMFGAKEVLSPITKKFSLWK